VQRAKNNPCWVTWLASCSRADSLDEAGGNAECWLLGKSSTAKTWRAGLAWFGLVKPSSYCLFRSLIDEMLDAPLLDASCSMSVSQSCLCEWSPSARTAADSLSRRAMEYAGASYSF